MDSIEIVENADCKIKREIKVRVPTYIEKENYNIIHIDDTFTSISICNNLESGDTNELYKIYFLVHFLKNIWFVVCMMKKMRLAILAW